MAFKTVIIKEIVYRKVRIMK